MTEKKIEPLPDIEAAQEQAQIIDRLEELKQDVIHGRVTQVAILVIDEDNPEGFHSRSLIYPDDIGPLQLMGLAKFFESEISHLVFNHSHDDDDDEPTEASEVPTGKLH